MRGRPRLKTEPLWKSVTMRVDLDLFKEIDLQAKSQNVGYSTLIRNFVEDGLKRNPLQSSSNQKPA